MTVDPQVMLDLIRLKLNWLEQDGIVARLAIGETAPKPRRWVVRVVARDLRGWGP